ncbi:protein disulfide isomerase-associated 5, isoform CRA_f [Rattus norvegicus]|uniref:Protein disulfide isomerase-associated 5, isoform CRA_f n=1 Tax=Rattus norvegicus TaxID=10116 RepID=A6IRG7_RAT|nr:protein disulfide isomerase-associated 5, isoform CRA_f [Rattus norvegicus]
MRVTARNWDLPVSSEPSGRETSRD